MYSSFNVVRLYHFIRHLYSFFLYATEKFPF
nr:MAG TPA: hypothetical protein [Caudoviricetes sp.]